MISFLNIFIVVLHIWFKSVVTTVTLFVRLGYGVKQRDNTMANHWTFMESLGEPNRPPSPGTYSKKRRIDAECPICGYFFWTNVSYIFYFILFFFGYCTFYQPSLLTICALWSPFSDKCKLHIFIYLFCSDIVYFNFILNLYVILNYFVLVLVGYFIIH